MFGGGGVATSNFSEPQGVVTTEETRGGGGGGDVGGTCAIARTVKAKPYRITLARSRGGRGTPKN